MVQRLGLRARRGFTLTELAIVLGIIGVIMGAIWVAAGAVSASNKTQKASGATLQVVANYRMLYSQHGVDVADGTDVTCTGVNAGFFPADLVPGVGCTIANTATYPITPWSNGSYMQVVMSQTNSGIQVVFAGLTKAACISFALAAANGQDVIQETINTTSENLPPLAANVPYTLTQLNTNCAATGNTVKIMYKAR